MCASGHRALSSRTRSPEWGAELPLPRILPVLALCPASPNLASRLGFPLQSRTHRARAPGARAASARCPGAADSPQDCRPAGQGPRGGRAARRGGAAAGNNAAYPAAPRAGRKGQHALSCSAASLAPPTTRHRALPSQLRAPETRKPPPSTKLLAPEDPRARTTIEGDGDCCRAKMSPAVLVDEGAKGRRHVRYRAGHRFPQRNLCGSLLTPSPALTHEHPALIRRHARTFFTHTETSARQHAQLHNSFSPKQWVALGELPGGPEHSDGQVLCAARQIVFPSLPSLYFLFSQ